MKYDKPPLSFEAQAVQLLKRGLSADRTVLIKCLENVNYYRFSGYLYPYRLPDDTFKPGTTLEKVWRHYAFDRRLRVIIIDAIERVEVSVRTQLAYVLAHETHALGYIDSKTFPNLIPLEHERLLKIIKDESERSKEVFVEHFFKKYGDSHEYLPIWMACEIMPFGCTLTMYRGVSDEIKKKIAAYYGIPDQVLTSWLQMINVVRNICAHHSRLWNRELGVKPFIPRKQKYPQWHIPVSVLMGARVQREVVLTQVSEVKDRLAEFFENTEGEYLISKPDIEKIISNAAISPDSKRALLVITQPPYRVFVVLTIAQYLLKIIAPQSKWKDRLTRLLDSYPEISRWSMGFPDKWQECLIWQ